MTDRSVTDSDSTSPAPPHLSVHWGEHDTTTDLALTRAATYRATSDGRLELVDAGPQCSPPAPA